MYIGVCACVCVHCCVYVMCFITVFCHPLEISLTIYSLTIDFSGNLSLIANDLRTLLSNQELADIVVCTAQGKRVLAHRIILSLRCEFFRKVNICNICMPWYTRRSVCVRFLVVSCGEFFRKVILFSCCVEMCLCVRCMAKRVLAHHIILSLRWSSSAR